jgi:ABC-type sugar transport system ATPase subunit
MIKIIESLGYGAKREEEVTEDREKEEREKEIRKLRLTLTASIILSAPLLLGMILSMIGINISFLHNAYFQLIIATPIQFIIGYRFYKHAFYALRSKSANMDVLIAMGTSAAYFFSLYNVFFEPEKMGGMKDLYFEAAAVIITLILLGKYLEAVAKGKTSEAIKKLMGLQAKTARVVRNGIEEDIEKNYELFPRLKERYNQQAGTLSGGEQQMLAIARALMSRPKLLLLDEPSMGLAPVIVERIYENILKIRKQGVTMMLVEQNANLALTISDYAYIIANGEIRLEGSTEELLKKENLISTYLGTN